VNAREVNAVFDNAITARNKPKRRETPTSKRQAIANAQIAALERAIASIRRRIRETPAWAQGYNSAITAIELEIQEIRNEL
jgi:ribosomal protein S11